MQYFINIIKKIASAFCMPFLVFYEFPLSRDSSDFTSLILPGRKNFLHNWLQHTLHKIFFQCTVYLNFVLLEEIAGDSSHYLTSTQIKIYFSKKRKCFTDSHSFWFYAQYLREINVFSPGSMALLCCHKLSSQNVTFYLIPLYHRKQNTNLCFNWVK